jgi:hypothetical protein
VSFELPLILKSGLVPEFGYLAIIMNYNEAMNKSSYDDYSNLNVKEDEEKPWAGFLETGIE